MAPDTNWISMCVYINMRAFTIITINLNSNDLELIFSQH